MFIVCYWFIFQLFLDWILNLWFSLWPFEPHCSCSVTLLSLISYIASHAQSMHIWLFSIGWWWGVCQMDLISQCPVLKYVSHHFNVLHQRPASTIFDLGISVAWKWILFPSLSGRHTYSASILHLLSNVDKTMRCGPLAVRRHYLSLKCALTHFLSP